MKDKEISSLQNEVEKIRQEFNSLADRLKSVESTIAQESLPSESTQPVSVLSSQIPISQLKSEQTPTRSNLLSPESDDSKDRTELRTPSHRIAGNLETKIGMYWLNRLGVVSIVLGIVFLILYSFQYFNAPFKLFTGFLIAGLFLFAGKKVGQNEKRRWYGHGLIGGGWSLAYFTTYAMYFIPNLKVIYSYPIEFALILGVCIAAMIHAIICQSEIIAILSVTLANASICLSEPSLISNVPILLIALCVSIIALRQNWYSLFAWLIGSSYIGHIFACRTEYFDYVSITQNITAIYYLVAIWLTFNISILFSKEDNISQRSIITIASCLNTTIFIVSLLALTNYNFSAQKYLFVAAAGCYYLLASPLLSLRKLKQSTMVHLLLGLSLVNIAIWMKFTGVSVVIFDLFQMAVLALLGLQYQIKSFRWFAMFLSLAFFPMWFAQYDITSSSHAFGLSSPNFAFIGILAVLFLTIICSLYRKKEYLASLGNFEKMVFKNAYFVFANCTTSCIPFAIENLSWSLIVYPIQAIVCSYLRLKYAERFFGWVAVLLSIFAGLELLLTINNWQWAPTIIVISAFYMLYVYCRQQSQAPEQGFLKWSKVFSIIAGNLVLTMLFWEKLSASWLSTGLALEGLALLAVGFVWKERIFRISGLLSLGLLMFKLLFVDLAQADTLQRIVSFIVSGVVLLIASYAYSRFTEKFGITKLSTDKSDS